MVVLKRTADARARRRPHLRGDPRRRRRERRPRRERDGAARRGRGAGAAAGLRGRRRLAARRVGLIEAHGTGDAGRRRRRGAGADARLRASARASCPHCALGTVKSMISHTIPAAGRRGRDQAALALHHRVLPPTLNCERAQPEARAREDAVLHQHRDAPVDPRRRRAAPRRRQRVRLRRHQRARRARGVRRAAQPLDHLPPWDSEVCHPRGRLAGGARRAGARGWPRRLERGAGRSASPTSPTRSTAARRGAERAVRLAIVADLARGSAREARAGDREAGAARAAGASRTSRASTTRPSRSAGRGRSCSSSRARARSTRTCSPTSACTSPRCARCSTAIDRIYARRSARLRRERLGLPAAGVLRRRSGARPRRA